MARRPWDERKHHRDPDGKFARMAGRVFGTGGNRTDAANAMRTQLGASERHARRMANFYADEPWYWANDETRFSIQPEAARDDWGANAITSQEQASVRDYTTGAYRKLNESLREGQPLTADQERLANDLRSVIDKAGRYETPVTVWRGVKIEAPPFGPNLAVTRAERETAYQRALADATEATYQPGTTLRLGGFQSTSFYTDPALNAATVNSQTFLNDLGTPGIIFEIRTDRGALLDSLSRFDDEAELLLSDDTEYKVVGVLREAEFQTGDYSDTVTRTVVQLEAL